METEGVLDGLRLFSKKDVAERARLSVRTLDGLAADPACPLKFTMPRNGKGKVCTAKVLQRFLEWLVSEDDVQAVG